MKKRRNTPPRLWDPVSHKPAGCDSWVVPTDFMNMYHLGEPTLNLSRDVSSPFRLYIGITSGAFKHANN